MTKIDITIDQLENTLTALDKLVDQHGAVCVGTAIQALIMQNPVVARFLVEANEIALDESAKRAADTCQCPACVAERQAKRGQA
jgi:hypothetical protein